jgi:hypothetical protein
MLLLTTLAHYCVIPDYQFCHSYRHHFFEASEKASCLFNSRPSDLLLGTNGSLVSSPGLAVEAGG